MPTLARLRDPWSCPPSMVSSRMRLISSNSSEVTKPTELALLESVACRAPTNLMTVSHFHPPDQTYQQTYTEPCRPTRKSNSTPLEPIHPQMRTFACAPALVAIVACSIVYRTHCNMVHAIECSIDLCGAIDNISAESGLQWGRGWGRVGMVCGGVRGGLGAK